jgi:hypothetical protein
LTGAPHSLDTGEVSVFGGTTRAAGFADGNNGIFRAAASLDVPAAPAPADGGRVQVSSAFHVTGDVLGPAGVPATLLFQMRFDGTFTNLQNANAGLEGIIEASTDPTVGGVVLYNSQFRFVDIWNGPLIANGAVFKLVDLGVGTIVSQPFPEGTAADTSSGGRLSAFLEIPLPIMPGQSLTLEGTLAVNVTQAGFALSAMGTADSLDTTIVSLLVPPRYGLTNLTGLSGAVQVVPEPSTYLMLALGLAILCIDSMRRSSHRRRPAPV